MDDQAGALLKAPAFFLRALVLFSSAWLSHFAMLSRQ
jgi:hypothetical protein